jgi:ribosomal protein S18 acetylase RimI-like enzyme
VAAHPETCAAELVELGRIRAAALEALLEEETLAWRRELDWDFRPSAELVRRFVELQSLGGYALLQEGRAVGYAYYVAEERKGLIGDLYVLERCRRPESEARLLGAALEALMRTRAVRRVESQLMLLAPGAERHLPAAAYLKRFERLFMAFEASRAAHLQPRPETGALLDRWTERRQEEAAQVIAAAYRGHIDGEVNDQYRSAAGARRFLYNIVQYPGCGTFFAPASWLAVAPASGRLCGLCLASLVAPDVGHITQVCVAPAARGRGLGYELLRRSLVALAEAGMRKVTLTVTSANRSAVELYERMGFATLRRFAALVWDGF